MNRAAFDVEAVDYLLKPLGPARFRKAIERVRRRFGGAPSAPLQLHVIEHGRVRAIAVADVVRFEARDDCVAGWTAAGRWLLSMRIGTLADRLEAVGFVRVHRSHLVNTAHARTCQALGGGRWRVTMTDGSTVDSSREGGRRIRRLARAS